MKMRAIKADREEAIMCNATVRERIKNAGVFHWQVAEALGVSESKFCRMLRREMPEDQQRKVLEAVEKAKTI